MVGCVLINFVIGSVYISGNVGIYFASYLRLYDSSVTMAQINTIFSIQFAVSIPAAQLGALMYLKLGAQATTAIGNGLVIVSVFATSFVHNLAAYICLYGALFGIGIGISVLSI